MAIETASAAPEKCQSPIDLDWLARKIEYRLYQDCIHCGLCTASCPTYIETGNENDSPRGRIYLMRAVADGRLGFSPEVREHLELCLDCRACESACPSGVQYGKLIEPFKVGIEQQAAATDARPKSDDWFHPYTLFALFPYPEKLRQSPPPPPLPHPPLLL